MSEDILSRLKKIYTLVKEGSPGERDSAENILKELMKKHDVCMADLMDDAVEIHEFSVRVKWHQKLLMQIVCMVSPDTLHYAKVKRKVAVELTRSNAVQVRMLFDIYKRAYEEGLDRLYVAFIHKHHIFRKDGEGGKCTMTHEESMAMERMIRSLNDVDVYKEIGG